MEPFDDLLTEMHAFFEARDWDQFHSPKNVAIALSIEAAEVLEHFRWMDDEESYTLPQETLDQLEDEIGDVLILLVQLANKLKISPLTAAHAKLKKLAHRYPVEQCKGKHLKYTHYESAKSV